MYSIALSEGSVFGNVEVIQAPHAQSSPDPEAGRNPSGHVGFVCIHPFQSSPDPEAGRNTGVAADSTFESLFQSSPDPEAGRN